MPQTHPESPRYHVDPPGILVIDWPDGHQSRLEPATLRRSCPCAGCREAREAAARVVEGVEPLPSNAGSFTLRRIEPVGHYGLAPVWGDGHAVGIYAWTDLRRLCGCFQCRLERGETR